MEPNDGDDPFDDFFAEIERMMNEMMGEDVAGDGLGPDVHVSVYETDDAVRVVADMPGVDEKSIDLRCDGETLTIDAASDRTDVRERVDLPVRVDERSASASFNNGVLEVTLARADDSADIDLL